MRLCKNIVAAVMLIMSGIITWSEESTLAAAIGFCAGIYLMFQFMRWLDAGVDELEEINTIL